MARGPSFRGDGNAIVRLFRAQNICARFFVENFPPKTKRERERNEKRKTKNENAATPFVLIPLFARVDRLV